MTGPDEGAPAPDTDPSLPAGESPPRPGRRGVVGPFSGRQLLAAAGVIAVAALALVLATRPISAPSGSGGPATPLPGATPFLVGEARTGLARGELAPELAWTAADGSPAVLLDLDGNPVRLEDLRGRPVWLNFWATWCPPCQAETPVLREIAERYGDRVAVVGIAVQETTPDDVRAYAERYELPFTIAFDTSADVFDLYRVYALPTQVFIGPDGRITDIVNGPLTVEAAERYLGIAPVASPGG